MKQVKGMLFSLNVSGTSFIKVYFNMTTSVRSFLSHDFSAHMDPPLDTLSTGCVSGYIRLVLYKGISNGYTSLKTR